MDFFIGKTVEEEADYEGEFAEFCDRLLNYLYKMSYVFGEELYLLKEIDPYDDVIIENQYLEIWLKMCDAIIESNILADYADEEEASNVFILREMIIEAMKNHLNLISLGD